ncbi:hypothetical protein SESBI_35482 [Sesbania bispinosa]|nr:hypothetical protein SESBI_35482 [Sesbania bispinosa]
MMSVVAPTLLPPSPKSRWMTWRPRMRDGEEEEEEHGEETEREIPDREAEEKEDGESILYDDDFNLDQPALMWVLANEEIANVHARVNFNQHLRVMEQQRLQQAAFMKYLCGTIVPHFQEVQSSNEELEKEVTGLKDGRVEAAKKAGEDLWVEKEQANKAGGALAGMDREEVADWDEEGSYRLENE